jgi:hypothetical protein
MEIILVALGVCLFGIFLISSSMLFKEHCNIHSTERTKEQVAETSNCIRCIFYTTLVSIVLLITLTIVYW